MLLKILAALPLLAALASCSSTYEIHAVVIDGKLAFVPASTDIWGEPDCVSAISVRERKVPAAGPGDVYWNKDFATTSCENPFPVFYGAKLRGPSFREVQKYDVEAKPLRIGVVYDVATLSERSAYGGGAFLITAQRRVVNISR